MNKKLSNIIWRSMGESILLGLLLFATIVYFLNSNGYLAPYVTIGEAVLNSLALIGIVVMIAVAFGFWTSYRIRRRLDALRDAMLLLEKGNLARKLPDLGDDEIGQLAEQLGRISNIWEEQVSSLQRLSTHNAELAEKARYSAIIEERQRLARELHDAVSQQLFAISMTATAVGRTLEKDFEKAKRQIALIEEMSAVAQSEMRALLLHLRPIHLEGKSLAAALEEILHELRAKVPIEIVTDIDPEIVLSKGIEDHLFRIVQEALSNTLRHSRASRLDVRMTRREEIIRLSISDNGVGFDLHAPKHTSYGIISMQERVNELGGSMNIITAPDKGTRIDIRIPIMSQEGE